MHNFDAVICVSSLEFPSLIDDDDAIDRTYDRQARTAFNLSGHPAISIPVGFSESHLPIGMQVVGKPFCERTVYRVAKALEQEKPWAQFWPPLCTQKNTPK